MADETPQNPLNNIPEAPRVAPVVQPEAAPLSQAPAPVAQVESAPLHEAPAAPVAAARVDEAPAPKAAPAMSFELPKAKYGIANKAAAPVSFKQEVKKNENPPIWSVALDGLAAAVSVAFAVLIVLDI